MVADKGKKQKSEVVEEEINGAEHIDGELVLSIEKLQEIQDELEKINEEASEKVLEVEQKYNEIRKPVYDKRNDTIKSIPDFWLTAFMSHPALSELLTEEDQKIFKYLNNLEVEDFKDVKSGYSISFIFKSNPYFEDSKITKTFNFLDEGVTKIISTPIKWKEGMVYPEGTHFMIPWFERPVIYDVRARPHLVESTSGSRDLQMVKIGLRVLTRPIPDQLPTVYRTLGENYNERVLPSIIHETLKAVVAQFNASQLLTQRENVSREIRKLLTERAASFNIALDDVSITSLTFGREFTAAIEAKQVAAQEAERAKFVVEKAEQDKQSAIIRAQGEAKSAQLIGQAIANNPAFITLRKIEASQEIARTVAASNNKVYLTSDDLLLNLHDLNSPQGGKK